MVGFAMRWLLIGLASSDGCAIGFNQPLLFSEGTPGLTQAPPPPSAVPANASRITALVRKYAALPPGQLKKVPPPLRSDEALYSLLLEIQTSVPEKPSLDSRAQPGVTLEALSSDFLPADLTGKTIAGTLKLIGDTNGVRWWISNVSEVQ
jgi:hypothetical protein